MYDISKLKNAAECRLVMGRAKDSHPDVYDAVFRRLVELSLPDVKNDPGSYPADDPNDPLVQDFQHGLAVYELLLSEKNGRTTPAHRTRQMLRSGKPVHQILLDWARKTTETPGFEILVKKGLPQHTGEYQLVKYADRFPVDVVQRARVRLEQHGVQPTQERNP